MLDFLLRKVGLRSNPENELKDGLFEEEASSQDDQDSALQDDLNGVDADEELSSSQEDEASPLENSSNSVHPEGELPSPQDDKASAPINGLNGVHSEAELPSPPNDKASAPINGLNGVHSEGELPSPPNDKASAPINGLNGVHAAEVSPPKLDVLPPENGAQTKEKLPSPTLDLLPSKKGAQPILFRAPKQAVSNKSLTFIPAFVLENILNVVTKYTNDKWETVDLAFANEIAALRQNPKYQGKPSLADDPEKCRTIDFIKAAFPVSQTNQSDLLVIDVVKTYTNKHGYTSLSRICDIIAGLNSLNKYASQINEAAKPPAELEILATYQDLYYKQGIELQDRLLAHSDLKIKRQGMTLQEEIRKAYPEESRIDLPEPRKTRSRSTCKST